MRVTRLIPLLFILLEACVDPLKIKLLPVTQKFVVDGLITNDPGPYEVKLSYTLGFDNTTLKKPPLVSGASVWICEDGGMCEKLNEISSGIYQTSKTGIHGQVGHAYYLKIKTATGNEYKTLPQRMLPAGEIENISFKFAPEGLKGNKPGEYIDALKVLVDSKGPNSDENLLRWRWNTTYKARTFPELRTNAFVVYTPPTYQWRYTPIPEKCSGYVANGPVIIKISECTCCECWPYDYSTDALISHNRLIDGNEFKKVDLGAIPATAMQFYDKYYIKVEQLSVSEEVYDFWNLVEKEQHMGGIFQPNAVKVRGNIIPLTDPTEEVVGIFGVSGITRKEMYISADVIPFKLPPIDTITHDCSDSFQNLYKVKPEFW